MQGPVSRDIIYAHGSVRAGLSTAAWRRGWLCCRTRLLLLASWFGSYAHADQQRSPSPLSADAGGGALPERERDLTSRTSRTRPGRPDLHADGRARQHLHRRVQPWATPPFYIVILHCHFTLSIYTVIDCRSLGIQIHGHFLSK
jgi:hypothetical protein